ncbi:hypothetical protein GCM10017044_00090 [Kordiimonas sediminis]|uniref:Tetratricopeptide repeat protein n=1 Tax=Kordiimonas sediminis TaxID=1735581 RepID=A0A919AIG3_9PROT|nr:tetratricopeptide repeat protein [Kordiimonas sediminis]GHF10388.1 hypothetical protein GCM10017044_00090 [Kordiimonas sediminis]
MSSAMVQSVLQQGVGALRQGNLVVAEKAFLSALSQAPDEPNGLHFLGLVRKQQNRPLEAEQLFRQSLGHSPHQPQVLNNLGNLLKELSRFDEAVNSYQEAVRQDEKFVDAWFNMGLALQAQSDHTAAIQSFDRAIALSPSLPKFYTAKGVSLKAVDRLEEAVTCYDQAIALDPSNFRAWHNKGVTLRLLQKTEAALECYTTILDAGKRIPELRFNNACALYDAGRTEEADEELRIAIGLNPGYLMAHEALNKLYWEHGQNEKFGKSYEMCIKADPKNVHLRTAFANQLNMAERREEAQSVLETAIAELGDASGFYHGLGIIAERQGEKDLAMEHFRRAIDLEPDVGRYRLDLAAHLIEREDYKEAESHIAVAEMADPLDQEMWAFKGLVWRFTGDDRAAWLNNYDAFVQASVLDTPEGYDCADHFWSELRSALVQMHTTERNPLDQSLRGGTQTPGRLLFQDIQVIQDYRKVLEKRIQEYIRSLPDDPTHPFLSRKTDGFRFTGSWSVRLKSEGFHVNHVHPQGWLSGPTYIEVPSVIRKDDPNKAGWVKFGETGLDLGDERQHVAKAVCPEVGLCALFPSYTWHGTYPFTSKEYRMTTPCDVSPLA